MEPQLFYIFLFLGAPSSPKWSDWPASYYRSETTLSVKTAAPKIGVNTTGEGNALPARRATAIKTALSGLIPSSGWPEEPTKSVPATLRAPLFRGRPGPVGKRRRPPLALAQPHRRH